MDLTLFVMGKDINNTCKPVKGKGEGESRYRDMLYRLPRPSRSFVLLHTVIHCKYVIIHHVVLLQPTTKERVANSSILA